MSFFNEIRNVILTDYSGFDKEFQPVSGLIGFFLNNTELRNKICRRPCPTRRPVIRSDRGPYERRGLRSAAPGSGGSS